MCVGRRTSCDNSAFRNLKNKQKCSHALYNNDTLLADSIVHKFINFEFRNNHFRLEPPSVNGRRNGAWLPHLKLSSQRFIATSRHWGYGCTLLHLSRFSQVRGGWRGCGWVLRWVEVTPGDMKRFHRFEDFVHVDEKWFYLYVEGQKFNLYDNEDLPVRKMPEHFFHHQSFLLHRP